MLLLADLLLVVLASHHHLSTLLFLNFQTGKSFALQANLVLHLRLLLASEVVLSPLGLILLFDHLGLLGLLLLLQHQGISDFVLLLGSLLSHQVILMGGHVLLLLFHLHLEDFLLMSRLNGTYLLHFFLVPLLKGRDVSGSLLGLIDLLPSFHLFLLEKGYAICQQQGVSFDTGTRHQKPGELTPFFASLPQQGTAFDSDKLAGPG